MYLQHEIMQLGEEKETIDQGIKKILSKDKKNSIERLFAPQQKQK